MSCLNLLKESDTITLFARLFHNVIAVYYGYRRREGKNKCSDSNQPVMMALAHVEIG